MTPPFARTGQVRHILQSAPIGASICQVGVPDETEELHPCNGEKSSPRRVPDRTEELPKNKTQEPLQATNSGTRLNQSQQRRFPMGAMTSLRNSRQPGLLRAVHARGDRTVLTFAKESPSRNRRTPPK